MEKNRAIKRMEEIHAIVDWTPIEDLLERTYPVGKSIEGNRAYPPILLMKCLLLQQWFRIDSDPELETRINDRISFLHNNASRARFTTIAKNATDALFRQFAFNLQRGTRILQHKTRE